MFCSYLTVAALAILVFVAGRTVADDELEDEFRDLFAELLQTPVQLRGSKHARDTSQVKNPKLKQSQHAKPNVKSSKQREAVDTPRLSPLFNCNHFDASARLCIHLRQLGTTLTLGVRVEEGTGPVHWYRVFHVREQPSQEQEHKFSFLEFTREAVPWNINIGGENGNELRISPVSETDFGQNFFLATLGPASDKKSPKKPLLMFRIEPIPIELGPLYHGEEMAIGVRSHVMLPASSVRYEWSRVGGDFELARDLPSNVRLSRDGSALLVKEYRSERDTLIACTIYSNKNVSVARRDFLLTKIVSSTNQKFEPIRRRRFLDDFYATERNTEDGLKSKIRAEAESDEVRFNEQETSTRTDLVDGPQETVLNFFAEDGTKSQSKEEQQEELPQLIEEANDVAEHPRRPEAEDSAALDVEAGRRPSFEDRESSMIATCDRDSDCGAGAACVRSEGVEGEATGKGFCRCGARYKGNGIFCWPL